MTTEEGLAQKVAALMNKAESSDFEAEREAFMEKAMELMRRHSLDEALVAQKRGEDGVPVEEPIVEVRLPLDGIYHHAWLDLGVKVSAANDCRNIKGGPTLDHKNGTLYVIGAQSKVMATELLFTSLMLQANRAMQAWWTEESGRHGVKYSGGTGFKMRREFLMGFARGVAPMLKKATEKATADFVRETGTSSETVALAVRDEKARVNDWIGEKYGRLSKGRGGRLAGGGYGASSAGQAAGARADTGRSGMTGARGAIGR